MPAHARDDDRLRGERVQNLQLVAKHAMAETCAMRPLRIAVAKMLSDPVCVVSVASQMEGG